MNSHVSFSSNVSPGSTLLNPDRLTPDIFRLFYRDRRRARNHPSQNVNLSASCISRGEAVCTTSPNSGLLILPLTAPGPKNWVWLKVLNVSRRNCRDLDSENRKFRSRAILELK